MSNPFHLMLLSLLLYILPGLSSPSLRLRVFLFSLTPRLTIRCSILEVALVLILPHSLIPFLFAFNITALYLSTRVVLIRFSSLAHSAAALIQH